MAKGSNIVNQYFKKAFSDYTLLIKIDPIRLKGMEITVYKDREPTLREIEIDADIFDDLKADGFLEASPLEYNLYLSGLIR